MGLLFVGVICVYTKAARGIPLPGDLLALPMDHHLLAWYFSGIVYSCHIWGPRGRGH